MDDAQSRVPAKAILTPHPGEMARLLKTSVDEVQSRRVEAAREATGRFGCTVVLKGACTVVASAGGPVMVSPFSNALLATAGTGDVLAGCIAGYLAQGIAPADAAALGVFAHGTAGERLARRYGTAGLLAGELADELPLAVRELVG
jgi:NAD(P)H-hydrate epimerase